MTIESDFDIIFSIVGCNRLAKSLLDSGLTVEDVKKMYEEWL